MQYGNVQDALPGRHVHGALDVSQHALTTDLSLTFTSLFFLLPAIL